MTDVTDSLSSNLNVYNRISFPLRNYLNLVNFEDGLKIATAKGILNAFWILGLTLTLSLGILGYRIWGSKDKNKDGKEEREVIAPLWFILLPVCVGIFYAWNEKSNKINQWKTENSNIASMEFNKSEYLNFRVQDDRQWKSSLTSLLGTFIIASSGLLNPFFRGFF